MKKLYTFQINKTIISEKPIEKEINGEITKVLEKVEEKIPKTYFIRKPSRSDYESADLFFDQHFSNYMRAGLITRSEIIKRFTNEDVVVKKIYEDYSKKEAELQRLNLSDEKTEDVLLKKEELQKEILAILIDIQNFEWNKSSVFDHTAENRARYKTALWWILNLSYQQENEEEIPLFLGKDFEEKIKSYDKILEGEDIHLKEVIERFFYLIPAWYSGNITEEKDFGKAEELLKVELDKVNKPAENV